jgi:hypothetical protein
MFAINVNKNSESTAIKKNLNAIFVIIVSVSFIKNFGNVGATHIHSNSKANQHSDKPILPEKCHIIPNKDQVICFGH